MVPRFVRTLSLTAVLALGLLGGLSRAFGADGKQTVTVLVSGQGTPVPDVKVTLAPDTGVTAEAWNVSNSTPIGIIPTDKTGHAVFNDVMPGRYIVTTSCGLPGNWIAGNYATKIEVIPARPSEVTLTLRRGAMIRGKAMQGGHVAARSEVRSDSPDALMSTCGMMTPTLVDTLTGAFTVSKIPLNATTWVKGEMPIGPGRIGVWRDFHFDKPDTVDMTLEFPTLGPKDVGSLELDLKPDKAAEQPDSGMAQLLQITSDGKWRYEANVVVGGSAGVTHISEMPAGPYQIRAYATPGSQKWWNVPVDSVTVEAGKTAKHTLKVTVRSPS
jgi:hypothetical protein